MHCPKCNGDMYSQRRGSVTIDECQKCGGIFLDRGELERMMEEETRYYNNPPQHHGGGGFLGGVFGGHHGRRGHH